MALARDGSKLRDLAARFGTPLYVYDADVIRERLARLESELTYRPLRVFYSAKSNPTVGVASALQRWGVGLDACSPGDLRLAQLAQFKREQISFTGFGVTDTEILAAAEQSGDLVLDSLGEIERAANLGIQRSIGLRVNPGIVAGFHAHVTAGARTAKFGIAASEVVSAARFASARGLPVIGLHGHIGSDVLAARPHAELLKTLTMIANALPGVRWLNVGGGFGTPRRPGQAPYPWRDLSASAMSLVSADREVRVEPGGYLLMDAGVLLTRIVAMKSAADGTQTLVVDANTNHLVSVLLYEAHHPVVAVSPNSLAPARPFRVVGNLMQAGDVLAEVARLTAPAVGDLLTLGHAGAYAASRAGTFNGRPRAAEVLVDGDTALLVRRAESIDDLYARDEPDPISHALGRPAAG